MDKRNKSKSNGKNPDPTKSTFETLEAWKAARESRIDTSRLVKTFPLDEKFRLSDQMVTSSRSVTANIAEGYGRYHYQQNIQFCRQARGSLYELLDHLTVALDEDYISKEIFESFRARLFSVVKILNGYIAFLRRRKDLGD